MKRSFSIVMVGGALAIFISFVLSPLASSSPDGLERVADDLKFADAASTSVPTTAVLPDYRIPGVKSPWWSTALAGLSGTLATFAVGAVVGRILTSRKSHQ